MSAQRPTRTYLAVPAHQRRMVEGAARSAADAVYLDLEDAVPAAEKPAALAGAVAALAELDWGSKRVAVRINAVGSAAAADEVAELSRSARLDALLIPKVETPSQLALAGSWADRADPYRRIAFEALIETALGLVNVEAIAGHAGRLAALHFGVGDFAGSIGARSAEIGETPPGYVHVATSGEGYATTPLDLWTYPMMRLLVAARAFGLRAIDGPCGAFRDVRLTAAWALKAASMGFDGKQVIHPSQIEPTRDAFIPAPVEVEFAGRVVAAMAAAAAEGRGAVAVDGKMVDLANLASARRILSMAGMLL